MSWQTSYVALDLESSGFGHHARILEIAAVTFEHGAIVKSYSQLVCPKDILWDDEHVQKAMAVSGLTREMLEGQPTFEQILPDLVVELAHPVWVAHNLDFDYSRIREEFERLGRTLAPPPMLICTMKLARKLNATADGNKLAEVASRYNVPQDEHHRALADATTCGHILAEMIRSGALPESEAAMEALGQRAHNSWQKKNR
jgi:DNA polymerase-3 subunit alpha (Gram-positive type)